MTTTTTIPEPTLMRESVLIEADRVRILDRRIFPLEKRFVDCPDVESVAQAIEAMVTQSMGPFLAATAAMVLAAREAQDLALAGRCEAMQVAAKRLRDTRPTNNAIRDSMTVLLEQMPVLAENAAFGAAMEEAVRALWTDRRARSASLGDAAASLVRDGDTILTHCWGETSIIATLESCLRAGKRISVICTETRPYLQGSRLTAHSVAEMGIPTTIITDGMAAHAMDSGMVSRFMTAADRVTLSGHVFNKVGTFQIAIAARALGVPFVAMVQEPDGLAPGPEDVRNEMRDGEEVLSCLGQRTATPLAKGWYPAFDVTPPEYVSAVATSRGVYSSLALEQVFA